MLGDVTRCLKAHGMFWKESEMFFMHAGGNAPLCVEAGLNHIDLCVEELSYKIPEVPSIKALGTVLEQRGKTDDAIELQMSKAKAAFFSNHDFFLSKRVSVGRKFKTNLVR